MAILKEEDGAILVKLSNAPGSIPVKGLGGGGEGIPEAPVDGKLYGRKNAAWEEVQGGSGGTSDYDDLENKPVWLADGVIDKGWDFSNGLDGFTCVLKYNDVDLFDKLNVNFHEANEEFSVGIDVVNASTFEQMVADDKPVKFKWSDDEGEIELEYKKNISVEFICAAYSVDEWLDCKAYGNIHLIDDTETDSEETYCALSWQGGGGNYRFFVMSTKTAIPAETLLTESSEKTSEVVEPGWYQLVNNNTFDFGQEGPIKLEFEVKVPEGATHIDVYFKYSHSAESADDGYVDDDGCQIFDVSSEQFLSFSKDDIMMDQSGAGLDGLYTWVSIDAYRDDPETGESTYLSGGKIRNIIISKPESYESDTAMPVGGGDGRWDENGMPRIYNVPDVGIRYREGFENAWLKSVNVSNGIQGDGTEDNPLKADIITDGSTIQGNGTWDSPLQVVGGGGDVPEDIECKSVTLNNPGWEEGGIVLNNTSYTDYGDEVRTIIKAPDDSQRQILIGCEADDGECGAIRLIIGPHEDGTFTDISPLSICQKYTYEDGTSQYISTHPDYVEYTNDSYDSDISVNLQYDDLYPVLDTIVNQKPSEDGKTYVLKCVNGELQWVEEV